MPRQIASTYRGDDGEAVNFICIITIKIEKTNIHSSDKKYKAYYAAFRAFTEYLCSCTPNIDGNDTNIR